MRKETTMKENMEKLLLDLGNLRQVTVSPHELLSGE